MKTFISFILILFSFSIQAQNNKLKGRVIESNDKGMTVPVEMATVSLLNTDSTLVKGAVTDHKGMFTIDKVASGNYIVSTSFVGYEPVFIAINNLDGTVDLGDIQLEESSVQLENVEITAANIINHVDKQVILPEKSAVEISSDVYDLMNNLNIPRLYVNPVMKTIEVSSGGGIQTRINGIKVTSGEFMSILPKDIVRIEFVENPGSRYDDPGLGAVVNIVTKRRESGGYVSFQATDSPYRLFGENYMTMKYNNRKSEWGLNFSNRNRGYTHRHKDVNEVYYLEDKTIERIQEGINDKSKNFTNDLSLSYNLYNPDKYVFNAVFRNSLKNVPYNNLQNRMYDNAGQEDYIYSKNLQKENSYIPSLDLYFMYQLPKKQTIELNAVGTLMSTNSEREYYEYPNFSNPLKIIETYVDGKKYSFIGEAIYTRNFDKFNISAGAKHSQMKTENKYSGTVSYFSDMQQSETYGFAEIVGKIGSFSYTAGAGVNRSWFQEGNANYTYWIFAPTIRLGWQPHKNSFIRYSFQMDPSIPTLSSLTDVELLLDTLQIIRGNPLLKTYKIYKNNLNYSYNKGIFRGFVNINHNYSKNPIMEDILIEGDKVVLTENNQIHFQQFDFDINLGLNGVTIGSLSRFLSVNAGFGYSRYNSKGWRYEHTFDDFNFNINVMLSYKNLSFLGQYRKYKSSLFGETIQNGPDMTALGIFWKKKDLQLGIAMLYPFTNNFRQGYERLSKNAPVVSWEYIKEAGQLLTLRLSYNFSFGRKHKAGNKNLNNADTDTGIINMNR